MPLKCLTIYYGTNGLWKHKDRIAGHDALEMSIFPKPSLMLSLLVGAPHGCVTIGAVDHTLFWLSNGCRLREC
jgi:hypothetical protein